MQVRGHLAASIDPLGLNNMDREEARKMIIRSVTVDEKVIDQCEKCPRNFVYISNLQQYYKTHFTCRTGILETGKM